MLFLLWEHLLTNDSHSPNPNSALAAGVVEQVFLDIPQLLRQVDVVVVRILKAFYLVPQGRDFLFAVSLHVGELRRCVDLLDRF